MQGLKEYLKDRSEMVDRKLDSILPPEGTRPEVLHKAMRYSVFSGGKRLRPILCLAASDVFGGDLEAALIPACAIELLHTYTLIHDDLPCMDDDDERRGKPTSHKVFGEANAVLAGDALQALAFGILAGTEDKTLPSSLLLKELGEAAGSLGVIAGQVEDISLDDGPVDVETIEFIHRHKTADLFRTAIRMGSITAGAGEDDLDRITSFAVNIGMAFQVADDLLDSGKGDDNGSCLAIYGEEKAREIAEGYIASAMSELNALNRSETAPLKAIAEYLINRTY